MLWLNFIGENSGAFYLDIFSTERHGHPDRFLWSMSGILGDGCWESPVLVEVGSDVQVTFFRDDWKGMRSSADLPPVDIGKLETAIREALCGRTATEREQMAAPHSSPRFSLPRRLYPLEDRSPHPKVSEPFLGAGNAA